MTTRTGLARPVAVASLVAGALALGAGAAAAAEAKLPRTMVWTAYDLGSSGYAEASGIANALMKKYDMRVRIVPSGTSIGRLLPVTTGKAGYGYLANETYFAAEGSYDFATQQWGPQDLRIVLGRLAGNGLACAGDAGIDTLADLKGKRIGYVKGNPSVNVKTDASLAFAGLTQNDVQPVWFGSYGALKTAIIANQLDCFSSVTTSANTREMEASPRGIAWPEFPPEDKAGWERISAVADFFQPLKETAGAGISKEKPKNLIGYRYPMIVTYARQSDDEVYALIKGIDEVFEDFAGTTGSAQNWALNIAGKPPADAPWHDGAIRYLKEKGVWDAEAQAWQEQRLERLKKVMSAWDAATEKFNTWRGEEQKKGNKVDPDDAWPKFWNDYRIEQGLGPAL
ncbi:TRAP transporter TAXI family solute receptor [Constrictibacter sp. MBR-5]|jgi:TRAP transporter TAXI family solute receptor|uniref:TAXI family TRAP transporter solute-binding subunit n=1 Tax=Constrictibacter sp. MBR-5 TaxID=3156467 RepID=UPI0033947BAE